jgi:hypothetical protein
VSQLDLFSRPVRPARPVPAAEPPRRCSCILRGSPSVCGLPGWWHDRGCGQHTAPPAEVLQREVGRGDAYLWRWLDPRGGPAAEQVQQMTSPKTASTTGDDDR